MSWDAYVRLAVDEIRMAGAGSPQVSRRLMALLKDLRTVVPSNRIGIVDREITLLMESSKAQFADDRDLELALEPDGEGIGEPAGATYGSSSSRER